MPSFPPTLWAATGQTWAYPCVQGQKSTHLWWPLRLAQMRTQNSDIKCHGRGSGSCHFHQVLSLDVLVCSPLPCEQMSQTRSTRSNYLSSMTKPHSALEQGMAPNRVLRGSPVLLSGKMREARSFLIHLPHEPNSPGSWLSSKYGCCY